MHLLQACIHKKGALRSRSHHSSRDCTFFIISWHAVASSPDNTRDAANISLPWQLPPNTRLRYRIIGIVTSEVD